MAQVVKLKRSSVEGKVPTTSNLELGELSINTHDGRIFFEKNDGSDSIEHIITTNSQTTGSIELIGNITASGGLSISGFSDISSSLANISSSVAALPDEPGQSIDYVRMKMSDARLRNGASAQDFGGTSLQTVEFDTQEDIEGSNLSTNTTNYRIIASTSGFYRITCNMTFDGSSVRQRPSIRFAINGSDILGEGIGYTRSSTGASEGSVNLTRVTELNSSDYITVEYKNYGTDTTTLGATEAIFEVEKLGGVQGPAGPSGSNAIPDGTISSSAQIEDALPAILPEVREFVTASKVFVLSQGGSTLKNIPLVSGTGVSNLTVDSDLKMQYSSTGNKLVVPNISASGEIIVSDITASGDIIPNNHITSNLGNDDNYFLTASIAHVRTFDSTIEFVDPTTKAPKGYLQITDDKGLEVKDGSNILTTISASKIRVTDKFQANNISFSGDLIGTITGGTF